MNIQENAIIKHSPFGCFIIEYPPYDASQMTINPFENSKILYGVYSIMRQKFCEGDSSRASICIKILK